MKITDKPLAIELLQSAKNNISLYNPYICLHLDMHIIYNYKNCTSTVYELKKWIVKLLKAEYSYDTWLYEYHYKKAIKMKGSDHLKARRQWIDWMVAQLKAASK